MTLYGITDPARAGERTPTFTFTLPGITPRQVCEQLAQRGILGWDGNYYALGIMDRLGLEGRGGATRLGFLRYHRAKRSTARWRRSARSRAPEPPARSAALCSCSPADVAELVDAHGSGPCGRKVVEVQVLSSAPRNKRNPAGGGSARRADPGHQQALKRAQNRRHRVSADWVARSAFDGPGRRAAAPSALPWGGAVRDLHDGRHGDVSRRRWLAARIELSRSNQQRQQ